MLFLLHAVSRRRGRWVLCFSLSGVILRTVPSLEQQRQEIRRLVDDRSPAQAFTAYYALHHDPRRTALFIHRTATGLPDGFLVRAQTGIDLFRPVVVLSAKTENVAIELCQAGLVANRPYYLVAPLRLGATVNRVLVVTDAEELRVYRLDPNRFEPQLNVLTVSNPAPDGSPRFEIGSNGIVHAAAGVNWRSPNFAEVYVYTEAAARGRGWGKAVVSALVAALLGGGHTPLYVVNDQNAPSITLAESVGFVDTGAREYAGQAVRRVPSSE